MEVLGFTVWLRALGFRVSGFRASGFGGFRVWDGVVFSGFRVESSCMGLICGFRVWGLVIRATRVLGFDRNLME